MSMVLTFKKPLPSILKEEQFQELSYGPGIVSKLRCRYMNLTYKQNFKNQLAPENGILYQKISSVKDEDSSTNHDLGNRKSRLPTKNNQLLRKKTMNNHSIDYEIKNVTLKYTTDVPTNSVKSKLKIFEFDNKNENGNETSKHNFDNANVYRRNLKNDDILSNSPGKILSLKKLRNKDENTDVKENLVKTKYLAKISERKNDLSLKCPTSQNFGEKSQIFGGLSQAMEGTQSDNKSIAFLYKQPTLQFKDNKNAIVKTVRDEMNLKILRKDNEKFIQKPSDAKNVAYAGLAENSVVFNFCERRSIPDYIPYKCLTSSDDSMIQVKIILV